MNKPPAFMKYIAVVIGTVLLVVTGYLYKNTRSFLDSAVATEGVVVDLVRRSSQQGTERKRTYSYYPVIEYQTLEGDLEAVAKTRRFESSSGSNPPSYHVNEQVAVLYLPSAPQEAKMDSFFALWLGPLICGVLGGLFFLIGLVQIIFQLAKR